MHLQDIAANRSISEALVYEENFFRSRPVSNFFLPCLLTYYEVILYMGMVLCSNTVLWRFWTWFGTCWYQESLIGHFDVVLQVYHSLSERCGVPQLAKKLNSVSSPFGDVAGSWFLSIFVLLNQLTIWIFCLPRFWCNTLGPYFLIWKRVSVLR